MSTEPTHSTPEQRLAVNLPVSTFEDLEVLSDEELMAVSTECQNDTVDSLSCVPCRAYEMLQEKQSAVLEAAKERLANLAPTQDVPAATTEASLTSVNGAKDVEDVRDVFVQQVSNLHATVERLLEGPPIPPPNVTMDELAALVVGADNWVSYMKGQIAMGLNPTEVVAQRVELIDGIVRRLKS